MLPAGNGRRRNSYRVVTPMWRTAERVSFFGRRSHLAGVLAWTRIREAMRRHECLATMIMHFPIYYRVSLGYPSEPALPPQALGGRQGRMLQVIHEPKGYYEADQGLMADAEGPTV